MSDKIWTKVAMPFGDAYINTDGAVTLVTVQRLGDSTFISHQDGCPNWETHQDIIDYFVDGDGCNEGHSTDIEEEDVEAELQEYGVINVVTATN